MNEAEKPEAKTGKRMVSKAEYVHSVKRRIRFCLTATGAGIPLVFCVRCIVSALLPPHKEAETKKRIVSKGEYVREQGQRAIIGVMGFGFGGLAILCGFATLLFLLGFFANLIALIASGEHRDSDGVLACLSGMLLFGGGTFAFVKMAYGATKAVFADPVVLLTRDNTGDLPAPESLVRASAEPVQEQEAVLLRAAAQASETPIEQLVRPVGDKSSYAEARETRSKNR